MEAWRLLLLVTLGELCGTMRLDDVLVKVAGLLET